MSSFSSRRRLTVDTAKKFPGKLYAQKWNWQCTTVKFAVHKSKFGSAEKSNWQSRKVKLAVNWSREHISCAFARYALRNACGRQWCYSCLWGCQAGRAQIVFVQMTKIRDPVCELMVAILFKHRLLFYTYYFGEGVSGCAVALPSQFHSTSLQKLNSSPSLVAQA